MVRWTVIFTTHFPLTRLATGHKETWMGTPDWSVLSNKVLTAMIILCIWDWCNRWIIASGKAVKGVGIATEIIGGKASQRKRKYMYMDTNIDHFTPLALRMRDKYAANIDFKLQFYSCGFTGKGLGFTRLCKLLSYLDTNEIVTTS